MRLSLLLLTVSIMVCCTSDDPSDPPSPTDSGEVDAAGSIDAARADGGSDMAAVDTAVSFCALADCADETPVCSELLGRCVQCTADADCSTAPLLTCETRGVGGGDPVFECVECVDDTVCAGGTCDLATHTCMP